MGLSYSSCANPSFLLSIEREIILQLDVHFFSDCVVFDIVEATHWKRTKPYGETLTITIFT